MKQKRSIDNRINKQQQDTKNFPLKKVERDLEVERKSNSSDNCTDTCGLSSWKPTTTKV